jgi:hypothetical protein
MATEYETFVRDPGAVLSGREVVLALRELTPGRKKYRGVNVRGVVSQVPRPGEPLLWLRSVVGVRSEKPCSLRIVAELPDTFDAPAYSDLFEAMKKAESVR